VDTLYDAHKQTIEKHLSTTRENLRCKLKKDNLKKDNLKKDNGSAAQSSEQAPFTSENVGSILATDTGEKSQSTLCRKFSPSALGSSHMGNVDRFG
jgi:hypothetical protein